MLINGIEDDSKKWKLMLLDGGINIVKMAIWAKVIYRFNAITNAGKGVGKREPS